MPAAAQSLVKGHVVDELGKLGADLAGLRGEERPFRVKPGEVAVYTVSVAGVSQVEVPLG